MGFAKIFMLSVLLAPFSGGWALFAAEFEVLDRFSVDGYTVFRGSADIPGGSFAVGVSTFVVKDGKVGIGTTNPGSLLQLYASRPVGKIEAFGDHAQLQLIAAGNTGGGSPSVDLYRGAANYYGKLFIERGTGGGNQPIFTGGLANDMILGSTALVPLKLGVNSDVKLTIDTTGNVGVGITNPAGLFQVGGGSLTVLSSGNIGIGTTNPVTNLDIAGTGSIKIPVGTTAERPASPVAGMMRINTTTGKLEYYYNSGWNSIGAVTATGGAINDSVSGYRIHTFTTATSPKTFTVTNGGTVEILVVAGGGGAAGGDYATGGGGGGAGGLIYRAAYLVTPGYSYSVTVGDGGAGAAGSGGNNGGNSVFDSLTAIGGGRGGAYSATAPNSGGSGGGGDYNHNTGGAGTSGQGNAGGSATSGQRTGGGGGGAGAAGGNGSNSNAGNGGAGLAYDISGTSTYYAGGGGGGSSDWTDPPTGGRFPGSGGAGGGGAGGRSIGTNAAVAGTSGQANTGGGAGGTALNGSSASAMSTVGASGGSGIVIIRYSN